MTAKLVRAIQRTIEIVSAQAVEGMSKFGSARAAEQDAEWRALAKRSAEEIVWTALQFGDRPAADLEPWALARIAREPITIFPNDVDMRLEALVADVIHVRGIIEAALAEDERCQD